MSLFKQRSATIVTKVGVVPAIRGMASGLVSAIIREGSKPGMGSAPGLLNKLESLPGAAQILRPLASQAAASPAYGGGAKSPTMVKEVPTTFGPPTPGTLPFEPFVPPAETILGVPKMVVYIGGGIGAVALLLFVLKKNK